MTDEEILSLTSRPATRETGFRHLVIKYQQRLYQVIRRQVTSHEDADDVLQNTFIKIFRHLGGFEGRAGLYTWMYRIAINETNNHHKARERRKEVNLETNDVRTAEPYINSDDVSQVLEAIVTRLPERQQMVFRMRYYDELSYKEMAEILQLTEGALKASYHHAVRKIEEELKAKQIV
jgi:RNA polymerase sigma-70 factor (ECF subfamily)